MPNNIDVQRTTFGPYPRHSDVNYDWPPGTVRIVDLATVHNGSIILGCDSSDDPNNPLNWSKQRKGVNFTIVCFYALMQFTFLDIGTVIWTQLNTELGISIEIMNASFAANTGGLAIGCFFLVPIAVNYGRRVVYLSTTAVQFILAVWQAKMTTAAELIIINAISGLVGAAAEVLLQMTIRDVFFLHQRATMNGIYIIMVAAGTFLAPVAAGYSAVTQGWRWIWWWCAIFIGANLVLIIFLYEETKFTCIPRTVIELAPETLLEPIENADSKEPRVSSGHAASAEPSNQTRHTELPRTSRWRLALITRTPGGSVRFIHLLKRFFVLLCTFPAVTYTAVIYGAILAWFAVILSTMSVYFTYEPYNFNDTGLGLLNLAPFIGSVLGALCGGPLNDWFSMKLARRNNGIFEPEMRLWMALPGVAATPAGIWLFGFTMAEGLPWIVPCVGMVLFGFGSAIVADTTLTYLTDCYADIVGDALVSVALVRNAFATVVVIVLQPWIDAMGLHGMFTTIGCLALATLLPTVPMIIWGKKIRIKTAKRHKAIIVERS
ncbi:MFS general substrate transporter [Lepidopterella palustris CBS 459.81]|uniref:MFS general substrate transporter n=1 Tax=Lepidopterella palustris CBS 459.81 TaxID=1314670 RepID=A0A8E2DX08_9PEZI|nr:MFS general substrate transporter [Lepidopterella palustris CBS 459.81]